MKFRQVLDDLDADIRQVSAYSADFSGGELRWTRKLSIAATPTMICSIFYRTSRWLHINGYRRLARFVAWLNFLVNKSIISPESVIGPGLYVPHTVGVVFQGHAGARLTLYAHAAVCSNTTTIGSITVNKDCPVLGDDVIIGARATVQGPVTIGSGSTVGLGIGLEQSLPARSIVIPEPSITIYGQRTACQNESCEPVMKGAN